MTKEASSFTPKFFFNEYEMENFVLLLETGSCLRDAISRTLYDCLTIDNANEGFALYCYDTAKQVLEGVYNDTTEIQEEINKIIDIGF